MSTQNYRGFVIDVRDSGYTGGFIGMVTMGQVVDEVLSADSEEAAFAACRSFIDVIEKGDLLQVGAFGPAVALSPGSFMETHYIAFKTPDGETFWGPVRDTEPT